MDDSQCPGATATAEATSALQPASARGEASLDEGLQAAVGAAFDPAHRPAPAVIRPKLRSTVFVGNCQAKALADVYRRFVAMSGETVATVASYTQLSEADRAQIESADVLVEQVLDFKQKTDAEEIEIAGRREYVPFAALGFLWPFAAQGHPRNLPMPFLGAGPYPQTLSDRWLNKMIVSGVQPEQAVADYLALDMPTAGNLDRLYELSIAQQRKRDEAGGFDIAGFIESRFREQPLFLTPYHPRLPIMRALMVELFPRLGAAAAAMERIERELTIAPIPMDELPIHPSVARHFGLRYGDARTRYRHFHQGFFTAEEFWLRYVRYQWVSELEEGSHLFWTGDVERAEQLVRAGLEQAPDSPQGHLVLSIIIGHGGDTAGAVAEAERAVALAPPGEVQFLEHLGRWRDRHASATANPAANHLTPAQPPPALPP